MTKGTYKAIYTIVESMFNDSNFMKRNKNAAIKFDITEEKAARIYDLGFDLVNRNTQRRIESGQIRVKVNS